MKNAILELSAQLAGSYSRESILCSFAAQDLLCPPPLAYYCFYKTEEGISRIFAIFSLPIFVKSFLL